MTKKDYILIAGALKEAFDENAFCLDTYQDKASFCAYLTRALSHDNNRFDIGKFLTACGIPELTSIEY